MLCSVVGREIWELICCGNISQQRCER